MNHKEIYSLQLSQKAFFQTGKTKDLSFRIAALRKLHTIIQDNEKQILQALKDDLGKPETEAYTSEIGIVLNEIDYTINHLSKWAKRKKVSTSFVNQPGKSYIYSEPYGTVLIISPWNYPFGLLMTPLVSAIAAGNCVICKPSEISANTSDLIARIINDNFPAEYIYVQQGDAEITQALINDSIDYVFFTGSTAVGRKVMQSAAEYLLPVTLELGGKNPCFVDSDVDIDVAARRIAWGKFFNSGQTCVAPDYLLVHRDIEAQFISKLQSVLDEFYNDNSEDLTSIINLAHFDRLSGLLNDGRVIYGGKLDRESLSISPTLLGEVDWNSKIMKDEIFGPILPIFVYDDLGKEIQRLSKMPKPLALYMFSKDKSCHSRIIGNTYSGGVCINGTIHSIISHSLPFGGVGASGMGAYHGKHSFDTFSHQKAVLKKSFFLDLKIVYPPYKSSLSILKRAVKYLY